MTSQSYKASGKYTLGGILLFLVGGLIGGFFLGAAYIYMLGLVSNMVLRSLVVVLYLGMVSGWLVLLVRGAKIRNTRVVLLLSIVVLFLTYYNSWVFYVNLVQDSWQKGAKEVWAYHFQFPLLLERWWELFSSPADLVSAMVKILPIGFLSINGKILKGIPLLIVWICEFNILLFVPLYHVVYRAGRPYDEEKGMWLGTKEEWTINYIDEYREIRNGIRRHSADALMAALEDVDFYHLKGQESYGIIEFYRNRNHIGPYITITNVKAVQAGPRKLDHRAIVVVKMVNIGYDLAQELYDRIKSSYETYEKTKPRFNLGSKQAWEDKLSSASFNLSRKTKNVTSEFKNSTKTKKRGRQPDAEELRRNNSEEAPASIEEITVHVPRVTPEMEKEYLKRKRR